MARIVLLCWRDSVHPQAGGSERYLENIGSRLRSRGHDVVYLTSRPDGAPRRGVVDGMPVVRAGGRFTVYPRALATLLRGRFGRGPAARPDLVIDTQNGIPFFARLVAGAPVVLLVHHTHREQWPVAGRLVATLGWWIESWLSPRVHRGTQYVTVSLPSADELTELGVDRRRIAVVRNGLDPVPPGVTPGDATTRHERPRLVVLSRLVPHKHVEDAFTALATLRDRLPDLELDVIGDGWWAATLRERAVDLGVAGAVHFHGHVDERRKHEILSGGWLHLLPSRKEGWGLAVMEAAQHGVPSIGYRHAAGVRDSIVDGETGHVVSDVAELTETAGRLLTDRDELTRLGDNARRRAAEFSWDATATQMESVLTSVVGGTTVTGVVTPSE